MDKEATPQSFDEFEADWLRRHRRSLPRKARTSSAREYFWIAFWVLVSIGAAVFSAAHTIPAAEMTIFRDVPNRSYLAISVFVFLELVIFGASAGRREIVWLKWLLWGAVLVALAGNIGSSVRAVNENGGDLLNQFGGVLLAIIAPITVLAAGEVLHIQLDKRTAKQESAKVEYEAQMKEVEQTINAQYTKYLKIFQTDNQTTRSASNPVLSVQTDNRQTGRGAFGYNRTSDGQQRVIEYLSENPSDAALPLRKLAELIGVNKDTVSAGRKAWQDQLGASSNGAVEYSVNGNANHD